MNFKEYISAAYENNFKEVHLTETDYSFFHRLLLWELDFGLFSVYKIYSRIKELGIERIAYKNVHQKMHKMFKLKLIEEAKGNYLHGAKFYRISPNGWFNLMLKYEFCYTSVCQPAIEKYYNKNIILDTFLSPYFELKTLKSFFDSTIAWYLLECCEQTIFNIESWEPDGKIIVEVPKEKSLEARVKGNYIMDFDINDKIATELELHVKSFLYRLIIENSRMDSLLSKDEKFMAAIQDMENEFHKGYNKLIQLRSSGD